MLRHSVVAVADVLHEAALRVQQQLCSRSHAVLHHSLRSLQPQRRLLPHAAHGLGEEEEAHTERVEDAPTEREEEAYTEKVEEEAYTERVEEEAYAERVEEVHAERVEEEAYTERVEGGYYYY